MAKTEPSQEKRHPTSVWCDDNTFAALERLVERSGETQSEVIRTLIRAADKNDRDGEIRRHIIALHSLVV